MFKKTLATALLVCTIPAMANASWFLTTQVKSAGGTLSTGNGSQVVTDGVITKSHTDLTNQSAATAVDAGYTLRYLTISDSSVDGTVPVSGSSFNPVDGHTYTVAAAFKVNSLAVTATNAGGTVSPSSVGSIYYGYKLPSDLTFTFSPKTGYAITGINNVPTSALVIKSVPGGVNKRATVTFKAGYFFTAAVNLQAVTVNNTASVNQILPQTVAAGSATSITAGVTNIDAPVFAWSYVSGPKNEIGYKTENGKVSTIVTPGPAVALSGAGTNKITFTAPAAPGQYKFQVKVGSLVKLATVNVVASLAGAGSNQCQFCHTANNIRTVADTSIHASCQACHFGGAGHPGSVNAGTVDAATFAVNLDNVANGSGTVAAKGTNFCESCHGVTGNAAQRVPALTTHQDKVCSDCHTSAHETHVASAACLSCHAAVHADKNMGTYGCIDCHNGHQPMANPSPFSSHPAVTLYTFEEIADQMNGGQKVPVQVDASGKGMPYSPKQTCSNTSGCHNYDQISDHAFHSAQGRNEFTDSANGKFDATKNKPWLQSAAMVGKW